MSIGVGAAIVPWLPWAAGAVVLGTTGALLGAGGILGRPDPVEVSLPVVLERTTPAFDCPGGSAVTELSANDRVLVLSRSEGSDYLAVRDPLDSRSTVWIPTSLVTVDPGEPAIDSLEIAGCPVPEVVVSVPVESPPIAPDAPAAPAGPAPAVDSPPVVQQVSLSAPPNVYCAGTALTLAAVVADDKGVNAVAVSWSGAFSGSGTMVRSGANWSLALTTPTAGCAAGTVTFTFTARDTANQASAPKTLNQTVEVFG